VLKPVSRIVEDFGERWRDEFGRVATRVADRWDRAGMLAWHLLRRGWSFLAGLLGLVLIEPALEQGDGGEEVIVEGDEQVDVVEVFPAREAVGEVVAWVDGSAHFAAARADETEVALARFARGALAAEGGDRDGHG